MGWSKIKNIIILLLVIVNVSLLVMVGQRYWRNEQNQRETRQRVIAMMEKNGPVTDQMRRDVMENVYHDSLINWVKSFR